MSANVVAEPEDVVPTCVKVVPSVERKISIALALVAFSVQAKSISLLETAVALRPLTAGMIWIGSLNDAGRLLVGVPPVAYATIALITASGLVSGDGDVPLIVKMPGAAVPVTVALTKVPSPQSM